MPDLLSLAAHLTRALPGRVGTSIGWHLGQRASREPRVAHLRTGGRIAVDVGDHLHRQVFFRGEYEPSVTNLFRSMASPGWTVVDVGANVGYFSVLASDLGGPGSRVLAIEPDPRIFELLALTASLNPEANIVVCAAACGSKPGAATLYVTPEDRNSGLGSLRDDLHETRGIDVQVMRVDDLCEEHGLHPRLVKIDVEGFELEVLRGCARLLEQRIPECFVVELAPHRQDPAPVIGFLEQCGYEPRKVRADGSLAPLGELDPVYEDVCFLRQPS